MLYPVVQVLNGFNAANAVLIYGIKQAAYRIPRTHSLAVYRVYGILAVTITLSNRMDELEYNLRFIEKYFTVKETVASLASQSSGSELKHDNCFTISSQRGKYI